MNKPVRVHTHKIQRFDDLPPAQQAGMLCNDPRFQTFAASRCGAPSTQFNSSAAAEYLRDCCQIDIRKTLNSDAVGQRQKSAMGNSLDRKHPMILNPEFDKAIAQAANDAVHYYSCMLKGC